MMMNTSIHGNETLEMIKKIEMRVKGWFLQSTISDPEV
jgi:hypothetical protein